MPNALDTHWSYSNVPTLALRVVGGTSDLFLLQAMILQRQMRKNNQSLGSVNVHCTTIRMVYRSSQRVDDISSLQIWSAEGRILDRKVYLCLTNPFVGS